MGNLYDVLIERENNKLRVFEAFAGYGSQSMSLRDLEVNHEVVGISEIDPDAIIAYGSIRYNIDDLHTDKTHDEMRTELMAKNIGKDFKTGKSKIPRMKKAKLEMLYKFSEASNNFGDISIINPSDLPDFDYFTYSFPCTDISVAGKQEGIIKGATRSGLLYECEKIIEAKRPKYLLMENVKNLVGKQFINQFKEWCEYLESLGYTNYHNNYKCLNAKDFGVAQNRERIFMVSILGEHKPYEFPKGFKLEKRLKDFLDTDIEDKYYLSDEIQKRFKQTKKDDGNNNIIGTTAPEFRTIGQRDLVYGKEASSIGSLVATDYKQPKQIVDKIIVEGNTNPSNHNATRVLNPDGISCTVMENHGKGVQIIDYADRIGGCFDDDKGKHQAGSVWNKNGLSPTLDTMQGGYRQPLVTEEINIEKVGHLDCKGWHEIETRVHSTNGLAPTVETRNRAKYIETINYKGKEIELPCVCASRGRNPENPSSRESGLPTEQHIELNTKGTSNAITTVQKDNYVLESHKIICEQRCDEGLRFFKNNICGTIRTIDAGGDKRVIEVEPNKVLIPQATKQGYAELTPPGVADLTYPNSKTRRGRVQENGQIVPTLTAAHQDLCYFEPNYRIRKLTPKECLRLMGVCDEDIAKMKSVGLSDSSLYKLAGNSIVKNVLDALHQNMFLEKDTSTPSNE